VSIALTPVLMPERILQDGFTMSIQEVGVYHLKDLDEHHFSLQTIGSGGQFLLSGINNMREAYRTPEEFYNLIIQKERERLERQMKKRQE
jgi:hypothetical protein